MREKDRETCRERETDRQRIDINNREVRLRMRLVMVTCGRGKRGEGNMSQVEVYNEISQVTLKVNFI